MIAKFIVDLRHALPGVVDIALQFAQRLRPLHQRTILVHHAVAGVFPGRVLIACGRSGLVLLKPVSITIAVGIDPVQAALGRRHMPDEQVAVSGSPPGRMQGNQIERRGVRCAVIRRVRDQFEVRQFAIAELVRDLSRFGVPIVIALRRLVAPEDIQRPASELWVNQHGLQGDDQAVAAEQRDEPRQAGGGYEHHVVGSRDRQSQGRHVENPLAKAAVELFVAGLDLQDRALPFLDRLGVLGFVALVGRFTRGGIAPLAVNQVIQQAAMPGRARLQRDFQAKAPVRMHRLGSGRLACDDHLPGKVLVVIGQSQLLPGRRPMRHDSATANDLFGLNLENIREVGSNGDLEVEPNRMLVVVGNLDVLAHAAADMPAEREPEGTRRNRTVLGQERAVGLKHPGAEISDRPTVQQVPGHAVGINIPTADHPCVEKVQPLVTGPFDLTIGIGNQYGLALVDGDLRWADLHFERHFSGPLLPGKQFNTPWPDVSRRTAADSHARMTTLPPRRPKPVLSAFRPSFQRANLPFGAAWDNAATKGAAAKGRALREHSGGRRRWHTCQNTRQR